MPHCFGNSHAIWNHTVLSVTRQRCHSRIHPSQVRLVLSLATRKWCNAELTQLADYTQRRYTRPKTVTHPSTNQAQCGATSFMRWITLPLCHAGVAGKVVDWWVMYRSVCALHCCRAGECGSSRAVYSQHIESSDSAASTDGYDGHRTSLSRM